jgi:predicted ABC-type ATPase
MTKRLRVLAGPNGSGKSSLVKKLEQKVKLGYWLNADELEVSLRENGIISLYDYGILEQDAQYLQVQLLDDKYGWVIAHNTLRLNKSIRVDSYAAANAIEFLRYTLLALGKSITFETVMSHESKLDFMQEAKSLNYKVYFYFVCLNSPELNISRVKERVLKGGHDVNERKIRDRYYRTLENATKATKISFRSFFFDNSKNELVLLAEYHQGEFHFHVETLPEWFDTYILQKLDTAT